MVVMGVVVVSTVEVVAGGRDSSGKYLASVEFAATTSTTTMTSTSATSTSMTTTSTTTTTTSITTSTTTWLQVNNECDPLIDNCDKSKNLVRALGDYKCRYGIAEESVLEKKNNVVAIVAALLAGCPPWLF